MYWFYIKSQYNVFRVSFKMTWRCCILHNIYNGIIFPTLNPAKIFRFNFR